MHLYRFSRVRCARMAASAALLVPTLTLAASAPPSPLALVAGKLDASAAPPVIDGRVTEPIWQTVRPYTDFIQQDPTEGAPATEKTEVRMIVGNGMVYIGIICFDSDPSKIIMSQSRRDASLADTDSIVMVLDTFNDSQNAFVFGTNPLGIEYDGQMAREGQTSGVAAPGTGTGKIGRASCRERV